MTRVLAWLSRPLWGHERWRLLLCAAVAALAAWWLGWAGSAFGLLALVRGRPQAIDWTAAEQATRARDALRAHEAALEADRALARVAAEARAQGEAGRQAAATDPIDVVVTRVEARAARARMLRSVVPVLPDDESDLAGEQARARERKP